MILAAALGLGAAPTLAQTDPDGAGLSRPMRVAVRFYEQGDDIQAMDRFMEILTKGDPSERSMANEYINLITHRMNTVGGAKGAPAPKAGVAAVEPAVPAAAAAPAPAAPPPAPEPRSRGAEVVTDTEAAAPRRAPRFDAIDEEPARPAPRERARARADDMPEANKALMRKEIRARLRAAVERSLGELREAEGVRVVMRENGDPEAIGIPSARLFQSGIAFQRDAAKVLDPLTKLVFALGGAQAVILPEGTAVGDAKVLDMRRTMGISSHLFSAGVAPPRVKVNLLNTQVTIPKPLQDYKGVVIVFVYNQPLALVMEGSFGDEQGPPISLGVYPQALKPARNQGAIIEFSVSDPPAGLVSWKFQLLQPTRDGAELAPLQEVVGGGPVFHQIFWNGRQNYFGQPLPSGRYECVLSATDAKNRTRSLHRWIQLLDDGGSAEALLSAKEEPAKGPATSVEAAPKEDAAKAPATAPTADLPGEAGKPLVSGVKPAAPAPAAAEPASKGVEIASRAPAKRVKRQVVKRAARGKKPGKADKGAERASLPKASDAAAAPAEDVASAPEAAPSEAPAAKSAAAAASRWDLAFNAGTYQLTAAAEKLLAKAAAAVPDHPLENLRITGHAASGESDGPALASQRAKLVASILVNRYQVAPKRLFMSPGAGEGGAKVELEFARAE